MSQYPLRRFLAFLLPALSLAQPARHDVIVVTGVADPVSVEDLNRSVVIFPVPGQLLVTNSLTDFLRQDASVDLGERAPNGVQTDVSIRGAGFGRTLVLLNGQRLNDAQSGHHNMDIPLPLEAISRIEILRGAGSTLYGSDAVGGVVNIITEPPEKTEVRLRSAAGNFGVNQERGVVSAVFHDLAEQLVFARDFSSGFRPGRDYRNLSLASITGFTSRLGRSNVDLGYSDKPFGADQFYGNFPSWEDTKTWFAGVEQDLGERTQVDFGYRRHSDLYVLFRDRPAIYTNHHSDETWQLSLRRNEPLAANTSLHYGVEGFHDSIESNNLGLHARSRGAAYAAADFHALHRFSLSLGVREEVYRSWSGQLCPTAAAGVWLSSTWKLRASTGRAFRVPSYTDLYYSDPANVGNANLRPEQAWNYEAGADWMPSRKLAASATWFDRHEKNGIDFVRATTAERFHAVNIDNLHFTGVEASVTVRPAAGHQIDVAYTGLHGAQQALEGLLSTYVFNYPSHQAVVSWRGQLGRHLLARTRFGVLNRRARAPYALWDLDAGWTARRVRPFLQLTNLTGTQYEEVVGIAMPGRAIVGGVELVVFSRK